MLTAQMKKISPTKASTPRMMMRVQVVMEGSYRMGCMRVAIGAQAWVSAAGRPRGRRARGLAGAVVGVDRRPRRLEILTRREVGREESHGGGGAAAGRAAPDALRRTGGHHRQEPCDHLARPRRAGAVAGPWDGSPRPRRPR